MASSTSLDDDVTSMNKQNPDRGIETANFTKQLSAGLGYEQTESRPRD